jgi:hypothetical protein
MRNPGGYEITTFPDRPAVESDTYTCCHCNTIVIVPPNKSPSDVGGWWCGLCSKPACGGCVGRCVPFEKWLDRLEAKARLHRAVGI